MSPRSRGLGFELVTALALVPLAFAPPVHAEDPEPLPSAAGETITVLADRRPVERRTAGSSVTVLDREAIERRHASTVLELLRAVPGLEVVQGGGPGRLASVFLRGAGSAQTLVLVDGVRVASPASGAYDFADLAVHEIERIEVLRGPQSGLYGAEAMGGVVAVYTRRGAEGRVATSLEVEGGSHGHALGRATVAAGDDRFAWRLAVADQTTDGVSAASEAAGNREEDGWELASLAGSASAALGRGRLDAILRLARSRTELDGFGFDGVAFRPTDDPNYVQRRETRLASLRYRTAVAGGWTQSFSLGLHDEDLEGTDPDSPFNPFAFDNRSLELGTTAEVALAAGHALTAGAAVEERSMVDAGFFDEDVRLGSLYVQDRWSRDDRLFVTAALRHDDHSTFGGETTGRLTLAVVPSASLRVHGSWGTGFRAPTFFDLFSPFGANPDLRPERSRGGDLGVELGASSGRLSFDLTAFDNRFEDLIVLDAAFIPQNLAEARARGLEGQLRADLAREVRLDASWTYTDSEDAATGAPLPRRPRNRGVLEVGFPLGDRARGLLTALRVAGRVDTGGAPMDDYTRVDLALDARLTPRLRLFLRGENVLDEDYEELPGFTTPGLAARVGLRADF